MKPKRPNSKIGTASWPKTKDRLLNKILRRCGGYYHPSDLFYHELWKQRLVNIGFRVLYVEKFPYHHVWDIRVYCSLTAQTYLLVSKPLPAKFAFCKDPLLMQLQSELLAIAKDLGLPVQRDCINVVRTGSYFRASFICRMGKPGRLLKKEKKPQAFCFLIRPWLLKNRN